MTAVLLRHHAMRVLPWWLALAAAITAHLYVIYLLEGLRAASGAWVPWLPLMLYLLVVGIDRRAAELELALPILARRLWLANVLALALGGGAILALSAAVMALRGRLVPVPGAVSEVIATALCFGVGLLVVLAATQSAQPALVRSGRTPPREGFLVAVLAVVPFVVLALDAVWLAALAAAALVLLYRTWRSLPPALTLEISEPERRTGVAVPERQHRPAAAPPSAIVRRWRPRRRRSPVAERARMIVDIHAHAERKRHKLYLWCFGWPGCAVLGLVLAGAVPPVGDLMGTSLLIVLPAWVLFSLTGSLGSTLRLLPMFDTLPVSRRFLFAATVAPAFAALALGLVIGASMGVRGGEESASIAAIVLVLVGVSWLGWIGFATRSRHREWGCSLYALILALLIVFLPLRLAAVKGQFGAPFSFVRRVAGELTRVLPGGDDTLCALSVVALVVAYVLAEARFRRFEAVPDRGGGDGEPRLFDDLRPWLRQFSGGAS